MIKITLCAICAALAVLASGCATSGARQDYSGAPAQDTLGGTLVGSHGASPQPDYYAILSDPGRF